MDGKTHWIGNRREVPYLALPVVTDVASLGRGWRLRPAVELEYAGTQGFAEHVHH